MHISEYIKDAMRTKFPSADFTKYFDFLEFCSTPIECAIHSHHIAPRAEFKELMKDKDNLIDLGVAEHFYAHYYLALAVPECKSFQTTFYMMSNFNASKVSTEDMPRYSEVYEKGREEQLNSVKTLWEDPEFRDAHSERSKRL
jgi:hypothetical protein